MDRDDRLGAGERLVLQLARRSSRRACRRRRRRSARRRSSVAPSPISSSGVKPIRSVGRGSSGCAARWATAAMISATPALSSAPSSVSPLEVTMSWPALPRQLGHVGRVEHRAVARQLDRRRRRSRGARSARRRRPARRGSCRRGRSARSRRAVDGRRQRGHHVAVVVERGVLEADRLQLLDEHARRGRAGPACSGARRCRRAGTGCRRGRSAGSARGGPGRAPRPAGRCRAPSPWRLAG